MRQLTAHTLGHRPRLEDEDTGSGHLRHGRAENVGNTLAGARGREFEAIFVNRPALTLNLLDQRQKRARERHQFFQGVAR